MSTNKNFLSVEHFIKIYDLFNKKKWYDREDKFNYSFKNYCDLISKFEDNEKELILELTEDFYCITIENYLGLLKELFMQLILSELELLSSKQIIISPLLPFNNLKDETKSSNLICYLFKSCEIKNIIESFFSDSKFKIIENYYSLKEKKIGTEVFFSKNIKNINIENSIIILVDDFIGSGQTAIQSIKFFENTLGVNTSNIRIISLASHQMSLELLQQKNINIYTGKTIKKGLSDKYEGSQLDEKIKLMNKIEKQLGVGKNYKLGYQGCEALIRLIRTPNNTFSFFYKKYGKTNGVFPR